MFKLILISLVAATLAQQRITYSTFERQQVGNRPIYIERRQTQATDEIERHEVNFSWSSLDDRFTFIFIESSYVSIQNLFIILRYKVFCYFPARYKFSIHSAISWYYIWGSLIQSKCQCCRNGTIDCQHDCLWIRKWTTWRN